MNSDDIKLFLAEDKKMLINGRWVEATKQRTFEVYDPATGDVIAKVADASEEQVNEAVKSARLALEGYEWKRMTPSDRTNILWKLADLLIKKQAFLVELEVLNQGKKKILAEHLDVQGSAETLRYYAGWSTKLEGSTLDISFPDLRPSGSQGIPYHSFSKKEPIGVVAAIVPWNVPLVMAIAKLAPALTAGCTVVLKPAQETPLTTLVLGELIIEAGFPKGVVNIVTGYGPLVPSMLAKHIDVDMVAYTGSTVVGKLIAEAAARSNLKRVTMELGGNRPVIVCADCNMEQAVDGVINGLFINSGQMCFAGSRVFIENEIYDTFMGMLVAKTLKLRIGSGDNPNTDITPVISANQRDRILETVQQAISDGAKLIIGGGSPEGSGFYVVPTILECPNNAITAVREEIFGPVMTVTRFDDAADIDYLAALANDTDYGLTASIWTSDLSRAHKLTAEIKVGMVWINCAYAFDEGLPFGGYKQSGWGREGSLDGVKEYLQSKSVIMAL